MHAVTAFPQESISRCSLSGADAHYYWNRPYSTAVVVYMQWWPTWPFCLLELQVFVVDIMWIYDQLISLQDEPMRVPDDYVMSIRLTFPSRRFSTTVRRVCTLFRTAVQFPDNLIHDSLQLLPPVVFRIEKHTDAYRIDAFVMNHVTF